MPQHLLKAFFVLALGGLIGLLACGGGHQQSTTPITVIPSISSIGPAVRIAGTSAFTLTVNGANFVAASVVTWNGNARPTTFVSATQLTAAVSAADIATAGSFAVVVSNPDGKSNSVVLVVKALTAISVSPANPSLAVGASQTFTATGTLSDASTQDLTGLVTWTSSVPNVATTTTQSGIATTHGIGRTRISANLGAITGSTTLIAVHTATGNVSRFAYVSADIDGTVSTYTVDATTGQMRQTGYVPAGAHLDAVTVDPSGRFLYVLDATSNKVAAFTIDGAGGLTPAPGSPFATGTAPDAIVIDPSGSFLYIANSGSSDVFAFAIDQVTGALTVAGSPIAAGVGPSWAVVDPSAKFLYVANPTSNNISAYAINATTGSLSPVPGSPFAAAGSPFGIDIDPAGHFLFTSNSAAANVSAFAINSTSGALTPVAGSPFATGAGVEVAGLTVAPSGNFVYVANFGSSSVSAFSVGANGALTAVTGSPFTVDSNPRSVTIDPTGKFAYVTTLSADQIEMFSIGANGALTVANRVRTRQGAFSFAMTTGTTPVAYTPKFVYAANLLSNNVSAFTVDANTGALTSAGAAAAGTRPFAVAADPGGRFVYTTNSGDNTLSGYTVNSTSGVLTPISNFVAPTGANPAGLTVDPSGKFVYVANFFGNNVSAFTIDPATGLLTPVVGSPFAAGPEPVAAAVDPGGRFLFIANQGGVGGGVCAPGIPCGLSAYAIEPGSGALTPVPGSPFLAGPEPSGLAVHPSRRFVYVSNQTTDTTFQFAIDPISGTLTQVGVTPPISGVAVSMTIEPSGRFAYLTDNLVFSIDSALGTVTQTATPFVEGTLPFSISAEASGKFVYVADQAGGIVALKIDPLTGALTAVAGSPFTAGNTPIGVTTVSAIH